MHRASSAPCHADEPEERETLSCPELLRDPLDPTGFNEPSEKLFDLVQVVFNSPGRRKLGKRRAPPPPPPCLCGRDFANVTFTSYPAENITVV